MGVNTLLVMGEKELVNELSDDEDEGYNFITATTKVENARTKRKRKTQEEEMSFTKESTKEELKAKLTALREAYEGLKDEFTRVEYEVDCLKDDNDQREEELKLKSSELFHLVQLLNLMKEERVRDKII